MVVSSFPPMNLELPSKPVQELIKSADKEVPERYRVQLPNKSDDNHSDIEYMDSPIIDLSLLSAGSSSQHEQELRKFLSVLNSWGCLQIINHGLSSSLLDRIREVGKEFFALPLEDKQKHSRTLDWFEGYEVIQLVRVRIITGMIDYISKFTLLNTGILSFGLNIYQISGKHWKSTQWK